MYMGYVCVRVYAYMDIYMYIYTTLTINNYAHIHTYIYIEYLLSSLLPRTIDRDLKRWLGVY